MVLFQQEGVNDNMLKFVYFNDIDYPTNKRWCLEVNHETFKYYQERIEHEFFSYHLHDSNLADYEYKHGKIFNVPGFYELVSQTADTEGSPLRFYLNLFNKFMNMVFNEGLTLLVNSNLGYCIKDESINVLLEKEFDLNTLEESWRTKLLKFPDEPEEEITIYQWGGWKNAHYYLKSNFNRVFTEKYNTFTEAKKEALKYTIDKYIHKGNSAFVYTRNGD